MENSLIDTRSLRKEAISMLKCGSSVDKTLRKTLGTTLKYDYDPSQSIGEESVISTAYLKSTPKAFEKGTLQTEHILTASSSECVQSFDSQFEQKCAYAFKAYSINSNGNSSSAYKGIPYDNIDDAILFLSDISQSRPLKKINKSRCFQQGLLVKYGDFKRYVNQIFCKINLINLESSTDSTDMNGLTASPKSPFRNPIIKQPQFPTTESMSPRNLAAAGSVLDPSPSVTTLKGNTVPIRYVKDALVEVFKKEKVASLISGGHFVGSTLESSQLTTSQLTLKKNLERNSSLNSNSDFTLHSSKKQLNQSKSVSSIFTDTSGDDEESNHDDDDESDLYNNNNNKKKKKDKNNTGDNIPVNLLRNTQSKQVMQLADPQQEYFAKWLKMKSQRDARQSRFDRKIARQEMIANFNRAVLNSERAEFDRSYAGRHAQQQEIALQRHEEVLRERKRLAENLRIRLERKQEQQWEETRFMQKVLRESAAMSRSMSQEEIFATHIPMRYEYGGAVGGGGCNSSTSIDFYGDGSTTDIGLELVTELQQQQHQQQQEPLYNSISEAAAAAMSPTVLIAASPTNNNNSNYYDNNNVVTSGITIENMKNINTYGDGGNSYYRLAPITHPAPRPSSKVAIPTMLTERMKNSKSLVAFQAARKDIRTHYERTMSLRIAAFTKSKQSSNATSSFYTAESESSSIGIKPILASELFQESVTSLPSRNDGNSYNASSSSSILNINGNTTRSNNSRKGGNYNNDVNKNSSINKAAARGKYGKTFSDDDDFSYHSKGSSGNNERQYTINDNIGSSQLYPAVPVATFENRPSSGMRAQTPLSPVPFARVDTAELAMSEYVSRRTEQQELFEMESLSLHSDQYQHRYFGNNYNQVLTTPGLTGHNRDKSREANSGSKKREKTNNGKSR